ncbi:MCE family protein [Lentzea flaviverrucosa]|uniref:Phospholipid/cholesterol/gamma-HCH transport system substrate-binding protein n=1 Tax=Lentzea flaviverrucosa TaxID=200379 RepID=A0A1H9NSR6_9PSEU|nr:MCE family protein [Lentzea flaviverrucosa]RDI30105.1 phospholipid/cholesterol/gamma-HCH transport system substrate-binding protein [Lentzea flaviverrucosa]SER38938.1 phospholipid/cholesterol/gamma-HCH transport system substrate-binding protein [Lentzea flaviverrucosa]
MRKLVVGLTALLLVSGCGSGGFDGVYNMPLPGGADVGDHPYRVKAQFKDVLDLVPQAGVKVNDVPVGRVEKIDLGADGWTAEVTMLVNGDVQLPANAFAKLRQSALLGEKFVELGKPAKDAAGKLADNAVIPLDRTNRNPEVEEVFGALSMLLNGGGVAQLQNITKELNAAMEGNEKEIRSLLGNLNTFVGELDKHKAEIVRALDSMNRLAGTLAQQRDKIAVALTDLEPGLKVLAEQRTQLVTLLQSLDKLSDVATDTINRSRDDIVADLKALQPTLTKLVESGQNLPKSLELLLTYPFPDEAVDGIKGDYTNAYIDLDLNLGTVLDNLGRSRQSPIDSLIPSQGTPLPMPNIPLPNLGQSTGSGLGDLLGGLLGGGRK